eukprot:PhF_6_TR35444/c0_g1_i4/m.51700
MWKLLGLTSPCTSKQELRKAYLKAVLTSHPDVSTANNAADHFRRITQAYHALCETLDGKSNNGKTNHTGDVSSSARSANRVRDSRYGSWDNLLATASALKRQNLERIQLHKDIASVIATPEKYLYPQEDDAATNNLRYVKFTITSPQSINVQENEESLTKLRMLLQPTHNITKFVKEVIRLRKQRSSFPKAPKPLLLVGRAALTARSITDSGGTMHPDFVTTLTPEGIAALEDTTIQMLSLQQRCEAQVKGIEMEIPGVCCYVDLDPRRMSLERMTRLTETTSQTKCFPHLNKRRNPCLEAIFLHHASSSPSTTESLVSSSVHVERDPYSCVISRAKVRAHIDISAAHSWNDFVHQLEMVDAQVAQRVEILKQVQEDVTKEVQPHIATPLRRMFPRITGMEFEFEQSFWRNIQKYGMYAEENNLLLPTLRVGANVQWKKDNDDDDASARVWWSEGSVVDGSSAFISKGELESSDGFHNWIQHISTSAWMNERVQDLVQTNEMTTIPILRSDTATVENVHTFVDVFRSSSVRWKVQQHNNSTGDDSHHRIGMVVGREDAKVGVTPKGDVCLPWNVTASEVSVGLEDGKFDEQRRIS